LYAESDVDIGKKVVGHRPAFTSLVLHKLEYLLVKIGLTEVGQSVYRDSGIFRALRGFVFSMCYSTCEHACD